MNKKRMFRKSRRTSSNMCVYCGNVDCDPMWPDTLAKVKMQKRLKLGLCPACGAKECICKRH